jgi:hypothetical protein
MAFGPGEQRDVANVMSNLSTRQDDPNKGMPSSLNILRVCTLLYEQRCKGMSETKDRTLRPCTETRLAKWGYGEIDPIDHWEWATSNADCGITR